jgi:hypothetical protein
MSGGGPPGAMRSIGREITPALVALGSGTRKLSTIVEALRSAIAHIE